MTTAAAIPANATPTPGSPAWLDLAREAPPFRHAVGRGALCRCRPA